MRRIKVSEAEKHNRQRSEDLRRYRARIWKGVYYFPSYSQAVAYAADNDKPSNRIIEYGRGWAIQLRASGPYVPGEE